MNRAMLGHKSSFCILVFLVFFASGCGKGDSRALGLGSDDSALRGSSSLEQQVRELQDSPLAGPCERNSYSQQIEMARALDQRAVAIAAFQAQAAPSQSYNTVPFGPILIRELRRPPTSPPDPNWKVDHFSWQSLFSEFETFKNEDVNSSWTWLNRQFKRILRLDRWRLQDGVVFHFDQNTSSWFLPLYLSLSECASHEQCILPSYFSAGSGVPNDFNGNAFYLRFSQAIQNAVTNQEKRVKIQEFYNLVIEDLNFFRFSWNFSVTRRSATELSVKMDAGPFFEVRDQLSRLIETKWQSPALSVFIEWVDQNLFPEVFKIFVGEGIGFQPFVNSYAKKMVLFNDVIKTSIPHEFGHILGFPDHYYEGWDAATCNYSDAYREDDLMSDSLQGSVTPEEWAELDRQYPFQR